MQDSSRTFFWYLLFLLWSIVVTGAFLWNFWPFMLMKLAEFGVL